MSVESAEARRVKRIVEFIIEGFPTARAAIMFGNTCEKVVKDDINRYVKFKQHIGTPNTPLVITEDFNGPTVLKMIFLEVVDQNAAQFIKDKLLRRMIL